MYHTILQAGQIANFDIKATETFTSAVYQVCCFSFQRKFEENKCDILLIFCLKQSLWLRYTLEPPLLGGSNEYPQSMFWSKHKKKGILLHTPVLQYKSGVQGGRGIYFTDMFS